MATRRDDRHHFFKYASFHTAMRVVESKSFRWSSPIKFNDPFDHQAGLVLDHKPDEFANLLTASIERMVFSDVVQGEPPKGYLAEAVMHMRSIRARLPREEFLGTIQKSAVQSANRLYDGVLLDEMNADLQKVLCHSRVFCVSELHDNVVMWSHYADEHRGVVFKLRCIEEIDNSLLAARKVSYSDAFPAFPSADDYARHLTGEQPIDFAPLCWKIAFRKHKDWAYEKEWRVHFQLLDQPPGEGYSIYPEDHRVFEAIYLGCRMEDKEVAAIVELIRRHLPATKIYRGTKSTTRFAISFTEIISNPSGEE